MTEKNDVNVSDSQSGGRSLDNLQAEFARKLEKQQEEINAKFEALAQKLDSMTVTDEEQQPDPVSVNEREELQKISAAPRRYVEQFVKPIEEKAARLEKEYQKTQSALLAAQWERMEDRIAMLEGKKDWKELSDEMQKGIMNEIRSRGWQGNPASAMDAYDIYKARHVNANASDPERRRRIEGQSEGNGRTVTNTGNLRTISHDALTELSRTSPSSPDYKKNLETLDKVQKGQIKVES